MRNERWDLIALPERCNDEGNPNDDSSDCDWTGVVITEWNVFTQNTKINIADIIMITFKITFKIILKIIKN